MRTARQCFCCPAPADSREHVLPAWVARYLGLAGRKFEHTTARNVAEYGEVPATNFRARILCRTCNGAFGTLEDAAKPRLIPLIDGQNAILDGEDQEVIAAWAVKTVFMQLAATRKRRSVPIGHRRHLRQTLTPPPAGCRVGIARYGGDRLRLRAGRWVNTPAPGRGDMRNVHPYTGVITIGALLLMVWGARRVPRDARIELRRHQVRQIWPIAERSLPWPPLWPVQAHEVDTLVTVRRPPYR